MMDFQTTLIDSAQRLFAANVTGVAITAPSPTATKPSGDGILGPVRGEFEAGNGAKIWFTGTDAANETLTALITGWTYVEGTDNAVGLWVPTPLLALSITLGTATGVAGAIVPETELFADTIAASGAYTSAYEIISPANNSPACLKLDFFGCALVQVQLARGTGASANAVGAVF
jgi:hypothetical protein